MPRKKQRARKKPAPPAASTNTASSAAQEINKVQTVDRGDYWYREMRKVAAHKTDVEQTLAGVLDLIRIATKYGEIKHTEQ